MASAPAPAIEADGVSFEVGGARLVEGVHLAVRAGQVMGILGPNGAGKSTFLKLVSGELEPTSGRILFDGVPIARAEPALLARRRAVVPQSSQLTFPFTALEVVLLGASVPGFGHARDAVAAAERALKRVGLIELAERRYTELSGGERQRVHIARAICQIETAPRRPGETPLLLVDEPTSNLDIGHQRLVLSAIREIAAEGAAVLAVLHDINLAAGYCDLLALLRDGRLIACGPPAEIVRNDLLSRTFGCEIDANTTPANTPFVLPITRDAVEGGQAAARVR
ncbi:heme ABC transporter ATP-binding protein [Hyphomicrobium sp.]|uniref:heme ABC transporter ATP-binding protein n=1 Tax=Hyphomicrobium sp. TaxID=82 RepID=UPI0025C224E6|nr:heme ABC transporter ATP-binding protein [Hyphomicrobium sp.]MCC7252429.1 heme ABC transporter ATP-binding protein [Hyphomicrobium sp.]